MELVNFVKCSKYRTVKSCCGKEMGADSENEGNEYNIEEFVFAGWKSKLENVQPVINLELIENGQKDCYEDPSSIPFLWPSSTKNSVYLPCSESSCETKEQTSAEYMQEETFSSLRAGQEKDFLCPRCGKRMQEPRLLSCLHAICSPCVVELMNKCDGTSEMCPLCDFRLPNSSSPVPPPHYPLQHRLIMDAIRCQLANRVLCDACSDEVLAVVQCSACLRNFCNDCGMEHQQQITMELKPSKHSVRPLWEATKVRRTALCQKHPSHALRFYCIACQQVPEHFRIIVLSDSQSGRAIANGFWLLFQVTCKECMWSIQHRGHASENAIGAGRRAALYLTMLLQKAKALLNHLLSQYDRDAFAESPLDDLQDQITDYRFSEERSRNGRKHWKHDPILSHRKQAQERIQEFARLQRARYLLDAISLVNELLSDGSDVEILSLASTIIKRLKALGAMHSLPNKKNENSNDSIQISLLKPVHTGIYHCCTFCSSGGKKEVVCGCRGTMPGGYRGCGHGHLGHPGVHHWSCCGSILRHGRCLAHRKSICQLVL